MKAAAKRKDFRPVAAQGDARRPRQCQDRGHHLAECRRHPARHGAARRDRDLHRPLGPSRHRPARCQWRPHLQWRDRQWHRHRPRDRAGARLRRRARGRSARSCSWPSTAEEKGLLGSEYYAANPLYPAGEDGRRDQHRRAWACSARRATSRSAATRSSACSTCWSRKAPSAAAASRPIPAPRAGSFYRSDHFTFAKVGMPALSASRRGSDLVNGGVARGAGLGSQYTGQHATTSRTTNIDPTGTSAAWSQDARIAPRGRPAAGQQPRLAQLERRTASSAPPATAAPASGARRPPPRRRRRSERG